MFFKESVGCCIRIKANWKLKTDSKLIFWSKLVVTYVTLDVVEKELWWLQQKCVIEPINYFAWAAPLVLKQQMEKSG